MGFVSFVSTRDAVVCGKAEVCMLSGTRLHSGRASRTSRTTTVGLTAAPAMSSSRLCLFLNIDPPTSDGRRASRPAKHADHSSRSFAPMRCQPAHVDLRHLAQYSAPRSGGPALGEDAHFSFNQGSRSGGGMPACNFSRFCRRYSRFCDPESG
jgi:hypothetical protein